MWEKWFFGTEEYEAKRDTFEFKQIEAQFRAYKAYLEFLYKKEV